MPSINERIREYNKMRDPALQQKKYAAISENVFRFFRGTCHIFYEDIVQDKLNITSPAGWICGDLHLENFGSFKGDNRLVYFDINDFDEGMLAPVHYELLRIVTSIFVALQSLNIENRKAEKLAALFLDNYADTLRNGRALYIERLTATGIICDFLEQASQKKQKEVIDKHIIKSGGETKIAARNGKYERLESKIESELLEFMQNWLTKDDDSPYNYKAIDCALRIAGTGSLGLKRYGFLLKSLNDKGSKFLLLDMKEAKSSATAAFVNTPQPVWQSEAQRITQIQKRMQNCPPALLTPECFNNEYYIIKELQPQKDGINFELFCDRYRDMCDVIGQMAVLTASAQLRSSGRQGSAIADELIAFGAVSGWQKTIIGYASSYAQRVESYFNEFVGQRKTSFYD